MTLMRQRIGRGLLLAMAGLVVSAFAASSAFAQESPPYTAYGTTGLEEGQVVEVFVAGQSCGTSTVTADGEWGPIHAGTEECPASEGDPITFTVDGAEATPDQAVSYTAGGAPEDAALGIVLTVGEPAEPADPVDDEAPAPAETGNAGIVGGSTSTSVALVLLLGVLGAVLIAGARVSTRRS